MIGAGSLGAGIALRWRERPGSFVVAFLVIDGIAQATDMYFKRRRVGDDAPLAYWVKAIYGVLDLVSSFPRTFKFAMLSGQCASWSVSSAGKLTGLVPIRWKAMSSTLRNGHGGKSGCK